VRCLALGRYLSDLLIIHREKLLARTRAIKVLNYAMQTEEGSDACERFVEVQGLKAR
jgi:beta-catenin-like protein 1